MTAFQQIKAECSSCHNWSGTDCTLIAPDTGCPYEKENKMMTYVGTKIIHAEPAEKDGQPGYKIVYPDNYESWSPKDVFELCYRPANNLTFGHALELLKQGQKVRRLGWNAKNQYITKIPAGNAMFQGYDMQDCFGIKNAQDKMQPGWVPSISDCLAEDWELA